MQEFFEVILLDMLMCVTCFVSFLIIKLAQKKVLAVNRANYAYILWMVSWTYYFISEAYSYEWSWVGLAHHLRVAPRISVF